ncbi:DNA polymerase III, epsilon subunit [Pseudonocardia dioxanivorans CB1190]|uniref:DNA polymerase III, epsilon subunit n=1 Tax=Pseudonocardia dioxanivorans (strain ATCC 55486 / DSM 44775 / JCM 13855 / CB1190) TaxID=675635 RepID=F4CL32_PSEUX|nr:DEDD exonuclease domain-containing protein [Pseudonocardia dioxanivorans]AEA24961.1 DNA polymerase III, epsilon subunit [Pseudonocardia dioxanivorans CB1190]
MPAPPGSAGSGGTVAQLSFDELGTPLREVTFVVLDLETTGGSSANHSITEIGAVKVRGGEVLGELATLVDPGTGVPPGVVALTGITTAMVTGAPRLAQVLPTLLEFMGGAVLVAHNAPFDAGFLRAACERHDRRWPRPPQLCTARLARAVLSRAEAPSVRLGALARLFGTATQPTHRALADARATVEVLHRLLERVGNLGVQSLEELLALARGASAHRPPEQVRRRRTLARDVPSAAGVYLFRGARDEVLYVGTSGDLRRRVRSYFTAAERRRRMRDMVSLAERVDTIVCAHALEAGVRELRLIAAHRPRYNRRSRNPGRAWWVVPTDEAFPRLSVVTTPRAPALGPFGSRRGATEAVETLLDALPLRSCTQRIPARSPAASPCVLHELGRCRAPCAGLQSVAEYAPGVHALQGLVAGADDAPLRRLADRVEALAARERFEAAAAGRDRLAALATALARAQQLAALAALPEVVGARPDGHGGWELAVVRHGRLAAADVARRGTPPMPVVESLRATARTILPADGPLAGASAEEVNLVRRWLTTGGTRLVHSEPSWAEPARGAAAWEGWARRARQAPLGSPSEITLG